MVMAEALLRVPDGATADKLIEDKLASAAFGFHGKGEDPCWLPPPAGRSASPPRCCSRARRRTTSSPAS